MGVMHVLEEIVNWLPIVNAIKFTFFGGKTNTRDGLSGLYNTIALVSALLLTVVIAIPMSVARDELDAVGYMYTRFGPLGCQLGFEWDVLKKLAEFSSDSISFFTVSLLVSVLQLMIMSTLPSELANDAEEKMAAFWDIQKYLTLFSVFTVLAGLYNFANVTIYVYTVKFPDLQNAQFCADRGWAVQNSSDTSFVWGPKFGFPEDFNGDAECDYGVIAADVHGTDNIFLDTMGYPETYLGCTHKRSSELYDFVNLRAILSALATIGAVVFVGYSALAYEKGASCYPKSCLEMCTSDRADDDSAAALAKAGLTDEDMQKLPNDLLWIALTECGITSTADKVKQVNRLRNGSATDSSSF